MGTKDKAIKRAVDRIISDITARTALGNAWDNVDEDIRAEIVSVWTEILTEELGTGSRS